VNPFFATHVPVLLGLVFAWLVLGLAGLVRSQRITWVAYTLFPLGALVAMGIAAVGFSALADGFVAEQVILPLGLPDLPCSEGAAVWSGGLISIPKNPNLRIRSLKTLPESGNARCRELAQRWPAPFSRQCISIAAIARASRR